MKFIVAQLGARRHYAIPRMLNDAKMLDRLYTDICGVKGWPKLLNLLPRKLKIDGVKRLLGRNPRGIPVSKITTFDRFGWKLSSKLRKNPSRSEFFEILLWAGKEFCENIIKKDIGSSDGIYTFNGAGLELLQYARSKGLKAVMEQTIAPMEIERKILFEEQNKYPTWQDPEPNDVWVKSYIARERAEWDAASIILCGSDFVRNGIAECGGPVERCIVLPYGVDSEQFSIPKRAVHTGPLRVLTVGAIGLRKGSPYVSEAAEKLKGIASFRMVGPLPQSLEIRSQLAKHLELVGPVPRTKILEHFQWADVFLLPSTCEGSATVTYEALATGLPVICTPNTGSVVRHGIDGYILNDLNSDEIVESIRQIIDNDLVPIMSFNARNRAAEYNIEEYKKRMLSILVGINIGK